MFLSSLLPNKTVASNLPLCCNKIVDNGTLSSDLESGIWDNFVFWIDKNAASELEKNAEKIRDIIEKNIVRIMLSGLGSKYNNWLLIQWNKKQQVK